MKSRIFLPCLLFIASLAAHEGGTFEENHFRFIVQHLPKLLYNNSGTVLLIGTSNLIYPQLCKQFPSVKFEELSIWNKKWWDETIKKRDLNGLFDCVVALHILEREPNREKVLQMISHLVRPGGKVLMYLDPQEEEAFDQRVEQRVRCSNWNNIIPIIPSLSIPEYQQIIEKMGLQVIEQSASEYKIYFVSDFGAFLSILFFACPRWQVPMNESDEELFSGEIRGCLKNRSELIKVPNSWPTSNHWIEDTLPTYYFVLQKQ